MLRPCRLRSHTACSRICNARSVRSDLEACQPTMRLEYTSVTNATYTNQGLVTSEVWCPEVLLQGCHHAQALSLRVPQGRDPGRQQSRVRRPNQRHRRRFRDLRVVFDRLAQEGGRRRPRQARCNRGRARRASGTPEAAAAVGTGERGAAPRRICPRRTCRDNDVPTCPRARRRRDSGDGSSILPASPTTAGSPTRSATGNSSRPTWRTRSSMPTETTPSSATGSSLTKPGWSATMCVTARCVDL